MIIKLREPFEWAIFSVKNRTVRAVRLLEDSMCESITGWLQGVKGQWLVEYGEGMRCIIDDESFHRQYRLTTGPPE